MYFTRVLLSIVFLLFASTALAVNSVEAPHGGTGGIEVDDVLNTVRPSGGTPEDTTYPIIQLRPEERDVDAPTVKSQITPEESALSNGNKSLAPELTLEEEPVEQQ